MHSCKWESIFQSDSSFNIFTHTQIHTEQNETSANLEIIMSSLYWQIQRKSSQKKLVLHLISHISWTQEEIDDGKKKMVSIYFCCNQKIAYSMNILQKCPNVLSLSTLLNDNYFNSRWYILHNIIHQKLCDSKHIKLYAKK